MTGDVNQLQENSLKKSRSEANGDLSSMPIHMADIGSDNYEQEFTLSLMENEEGAPDKSRPRWSASKREGMGPARNAGPRFPRPG